MLAMVGWGAAKKAATTVLPKVVKFGTRLVPYYAIKWSTYLIVKRR